MPKFGEADVNPEDDEVRPEDLIGEDSTLGLPLDTSLVRLNRKDLREAAQSLTLSQVRFLVDQYYQWQLMRIATNNQVRQYEESGEPHTAVSWAAAQLISMEKDVQVMLDAYTSIYEPTGMAQWMRSIPGIGPVIAAGLCAHLKLHEPPPTVGHWWRFAGLEPTLDWLGKDRAQKAVDDAYKVLGLSDRDAPGPEVYTYLSQMVARSAASLEKMALDYKTNKISKRALVAGLAKRPYNLRLKVLTAFKLGESFVKVQNREGDIYGKIYAARKGYEAAKNEKGAYAEQAAQKLRTSRYVEDTKAKQLLTAGKLPPIAIHTRARRFAVKFFLSDLHAEAYKRAYGKPAPMPYALAHLGHTDLIDHWHNFENAPVEVDQHPRKVDK